jgi:hypothetical protein
MENKNIVMILGRSAIFSTYIPEMWILCIIDYNPLIITQVQYQWKISPSYCGSKQLM